MKAWKISLVAAALLSGCDVPSKSQDAEQQVAVQEIAGFKILDQVNAEPGKTAIPYKKFKLDNGLTVILHQDDSDPLVHVDVTYHVGSGREDIGKSGFAHFFEHMMFQGSENVADEEHFKIISEAGGITGGTTNSDRTNYFETVPVNQLETVLWLEADRMGFLLDSVTQEKFEVQREAVKNERGERVDNKPYGRLSERVSQAMYPDGHPYSWPVIGFMDDLNRVNVNDLKAFFLKWYGPNNATLTIGGDINANEILPLVTKYFAPIPKGPEIPKVEKGEEAYKRVRRRHADIFDYYYNNHLLYPDNHDLNNDLYNAGLRLQQDIYYAGYYPRVTFDYVKEKIIGDSDKSAISKLGAQDRVKGALQKAGDYASIVYEVIVNNNSAKHKMKKFRQGLFRLCDYYEI